MRSIFRRIASAALSCAIFCTGCTKTRVTTLGRNESLVCETSQRAKYIGTYTALWTESDRKHLHEIPGSDRFVHTGERLGFKRLGDGQVIAVHGDVRLPLNGVPATAKYVVWRNTAKVRTQFGREVDKVGEGTLHVVQGTALVLIGVGVAALVIYVVLHPSDDCDSTDSNY